MGSHLIDAHIHLDRYEDGERQYILENLEDMQVDALIAVSNDLESSRKQLQLAQQDSRIKPAVGYHPEQPLPGETEMQDILDLVERHQESIVAVGEVGLPYYMRRNEIDLDMVPYVEVLERFVAQAAQCGLPIVLHAIREDAALVCDLLETYQIRDAHFHWFKGDDEILERVIANDYLLSVTPDITYRTDIQHIAQQTPLSHLMVETDGPWMFEGPFSGKMTIPGMMHRSVQTIAELKQTDLEETYRYIHETTRRFYHMPSR